MKFKKIAVPVLIVAFIVGGLFFAGNMFLRETASAEEVGISLDDANYIIERESGKFQVLLPSGRPRVPEIICESATKIYQPFFGYGEQKTTGMVIIGDKSYEINFIKDPLKGFELQYDDNLYYCPEGMTAPVYTVSDPNVAQVDAWGNVVIKGLSEHGVVVSATENGVTEKLVITRTVKAPLSIYMIAGQSNAAYYYVNPSEATETRLGSAYYYGPSPRNEGDFYPGASDIRSMNNPDGTMAIGNLEPALASTLYHSMGEKVLILNAGRSAVSAIEYTPEEDTSYTYTKNLWDGLLSDMETNYSGFFEPRIRSYVWLQGESDYKVTPEEYTSKFAFVHDTFKTSWNLDYGFIIKVGRGNNKEWAENPREAQEQIVKDYSDIFMGSRGSNNCTIENGLYREDNLHYTQRGDNILGTEAAQAIARIYKEKASE